MKDGKRTQPSIPGLVESAAVLCVLTWMLGNLGNTWWGFDLLSHFRLQQIAGLAVAGTILFLYKRRKTAGASFAAATIITLLTIPQIQTEQDAQNTKPEIEITAFNVNSHNPRKEEAINHLLEKDSEIVILFEINEDWGRYLEALSKKYPFKVEAPSTDNYGIAVYSKIPFEGGIRAQGAHSLKIVDITVGLEEKPIRILGVHTLTPLTEANYIRRNQQLAEMDNLAQKSPTVIIGDFNTTPFSPQYQKLVRESGLKRPTGVWPTWMHTLPLDQALTSKELNTTEAKLGPYVGSDHRALTIRIQ